MIGRGGICSLNDGSSNRKGASKKRRPSYLQKINEKWRSEYGVYQSTVSSKLDPSLHELNCSKKSKDDTETIIYNCRKRLLDNLNEDYEEVYLIKSCYSADDVDHSTGYLSKFDLVCIQDSMITCQDDAADGKRALPYESILNKL